MTPLQQKRHLVQAPQKQWKYREKEVCTYLPWRKRWLGFKNSASFRGIRDMNGDTCATFQNHEGVKQHSQTTQAGQTQEEALGHARQS